jgi:hypothetical protein
MKMVNKEGMKMVNKSMNYIHFNKNQENGNFATLRCQIKMIR